MVYWSMPTYTTFSSNFFFWSRGVGEVRIAFESLGDEATIRLPFLNLEW